jgi:predicted ATP-grasp superfamily ATP-dependent carboligase
VERVPSPPAAVVLGGTYNGLAFARSLGRRGIPVHVLDGDRRNPALHSRHAIPVLLPELEQHPRAWLDALSGIARRADAPPVLIPTGDTQLLLVSRNRDELSATFRFRVPEPDVVEMLCDKAAQYAFAREHGTSMPEFVDTRDRSADDLVAATREHIGFPCIVKPCRSDRWHRRRPGEKLRVVADEQELRHVLAETAAAGLRVLVQEIVPGGDDHMHSCIAYLGDGGRPLLTFTKQKLRQHPPGFGNGSLQRTTHEPELIAATLALLAPLDYRGAVCVEWKRHPQDDRPRLVEVNPRSVAGTQMMVDAGCDLPYVQYRDLVGDPLPPVTSYTDDVRHVNLAWDLHAFLELRRRGAMTLREWRRSLRGVRSFALLDRRDPRPAWTLAGRLLDRLRG